MATCPICLSALAVVRQREGVYYPCASCDGRALTIPQTQRLFGDRIASKALRLMKLSSGHGKFACPFCSQPMITLSMQEPLLQIEACQPCSILWFDAPSFATLPQIGVGSTSTLTTQVIDILAMTRLKEFNERQEAERKQAKKRKRFGTPFGGSDRPDTSEKP